MGEAYVILTQSRSENKGDSNDFVFSAAFRPLALDFGDWSIGFGSSYVASLSRGEERDSFTPELETPEIPPYTIIGYEAKDSEAYSITQTLAFSMIGSFPTLEMQMSMDIGYAWTELTVDVGTATALIETGGNPVPLIYHDYRYRQRTEGTFLRWEFRKFMPNYIVFHDVTFLNFVSVALYNIYNRKTTMRRSRVDWVRWDLSSVLGPPWQPVVDEYNVDLPAEIVHPQFPLFLRMPAPDPQDDEAEGPSDKIVEANVFAFDIILRLCTFPVKLPVFHAEGISIDALCTIAHTTGELMGDDLHGLGISLGTELSLFDVLFIGYTYHWEMKNDLDDSMTLTIGIGLYG